MENVLLLQSPPPKLVEVQRDIYTAGALDFLAKLHREFDADIEHLYKQRLKRKVDVQSTDGLQFLHSKARDDANWKVGPLPTRLQ